MMPYYICGDIQLHYKIKTRIADANPLNFRTVESYYLTTQNQPYASALVPLATSDC
jgi:hypothetical protein